MSKSIQVLVATMNLKNIQTLLNKMHIKGSATVVNQITEPETGEHSRLQVKDSTLLNYHERGLSRSRNRALDASSAYICVIADDDMYYEEGYEKVIKAAYTELPDADIIAFRIDNSDGTSRQLKSGRVDLLHSMKVCSVQITFRLNRIKEFGLSFDENFGTGTKNYMGEENIFLADCLRAGLKIYSCPVKIAELSDSDSTWFKGYDTDYFKVKGKVFYRISSTLSLLFALQFAIRKYGLYRDTVTFFGALGSMLDGINDQRRVS